MPLEPLRIIKNWMKNLRAREQCWDEIADKVTAFAGRTNNNLKQLGLDVGGSSYDFNNNGVRTQTTPITTRLSALESVEYAFGVRNLGLDLTDPAKVKIVSSDGTDLSSSNKGYVTFNSTTDAGQLVTREITANIEVTLTGAHWGFGTLGDVSDQILHILLIDTGSQVILGVGIQAGRQTVTQADDETVATSVTAETDVLVSSALSAENNCIYLGYVKANFDDTGNANGEDYWEIQTGVGDVNVGRGEPSLVDGRFTGDVSVGGGLDVVDDFKAGGFSNIQADTKSFRNLGLDVSDTTKIIIAHRDGTALSSTNEGRVSIRDSSNPGQVVDIDVEANLEVTLTGAHWGHGGGGDLTDYKLYIILIENAGVITLGVTPLPWLTYVAGANCNIAAADCTTINDVLVDSAVGDDSACIYMGWINANFDDTGGASEDLWTIQTALSDIQIGENRVNTRGTGTSVGIGGVAISDEVTAFNGTSTSFVDVTNLSVTLTTIGRPVMVQLVPSNSSQPAVVGAYDTTGEEADAIFQICRDGTGITQSMVYVVAESDAANPGVRSVIPPGAVCHLDVVAAGTYDYKVQVKRITGNYRIGYVKLIAYEL